MNSDFFQSLALGDGTRAWIRDIGAASRESHVTGPWITLSICPPDKAQAEISLRPCDYQRDGGGAYWRFYMDGFLSLRGEITANKVYRGIGHGIGLSVSSASPRVNRALLTDCGPMG